MEVNGQPVSPKHPRDAVRAGIALVPEDRKAQGVILNLAIRDNVAMVGMGRWQRSGFVNDGKIDKVADSARDSLRIRTSDDPSASVHALGRKSAEGRFGKVDAAQSPHLPPR